MTGRTATVMATEAIIVFPTCVFVSPRSSRTITISGAMPNQLMWNARIWGVFMSSKLIRSLCSSRERTTNPLVEQIGSGRLDGHRQGTAGGASYPFGCCLVPARAR